MTGVLMILNAFVLTIFFVDSFHRSSFASTFILILLIAVSCTFWVGYWLGGLS